ncbi:MAG: bifunctional nicotinamide-nucleotide adenylyltransferase/Nudix hydroxylase [Candidatus Thorarchaeota archaeon]|nr:MAG: bifunctional nicotinamide-nucleotide adenylyltransferase/Nudix hydroxylase [Candidatus Thorarchaeota archaeon]
MSSKEYQFDYLVFIGRFQPLHSGHLAVFKQALDIAENVIVVVGSANQPRTPKDPWTYGERYEMILQSLKAEGLFDADRVHFTCIRDQIYNDQNWAASVQEVVTSAKRGWHDIDRIGIIGHNKDESSYYLKMFPQWKLVEHENLDILNATDIRRLYFEGFNSRYLKAAVPEPVFKYLEWFKVNKPEYKMLVREFDFINKYKKGWEVAPYPVTIMTGDALVVQSGHLLLVQRRSSPGEGLCALPGGHIDPNETVEECAIRELREETKLKVPAPVLRGSIKASKLFDSPKRSLKGRVITTAYLIELPPGPLPAVKGSSDAKKARWVPINEIRSDEMFEDHFDIIRYFNIGNKN